KSSLPLVRRKRSPPQKRRTTFPLCADGGDLVQMGLVKSFAHPGGNAAGLTFDLASKRTQILKEAVPSGKRVAISWNPDNMINKLELKEAITTADPLTLTPFPVEIRILDDIDAAFAGMTKKAVDALVLPALSHSRSARGL